MTKENKKQIQAFKEEFKDQLQDLDLAREPFRNISVDTVIANLAIEDCEEEIVCINDLSDIESEESDDSDIEII